MWRRLQCRQRLSANTDFVSTGCSCMEVLRRFSNGRLLVRGSEAHGLSKMGPHHFSCMLPVCRQTGELLDAFCGFRTDIDLNGRKERIIFISSQKRRGRTPARTELQWAPRLAKIKDKRTSHDSDVRPCTSGMATHSHNLRRQAIPS